MKKLFWTLALMMCWACIGQIDDPEDAEPSEIVDPQGGGQDTGTRFYHRILALDFTGSWCQYCPNMATAIETAKKVRPGRIVDIAVHYGDEMSPPVSPTLVQRFSVSAFPTAVMDLDPLTRFSRQDASIFTAYVDKTIPEQTCGLALETAVKNGTLTLTITVKASTAGTYSAAAALVEDGILSNQAGAGDRYVNRSVLWGFLGKGGMDGTVLGTLSAGEEQTLTLTTSVQEPISQKRIVAYVLRDGRRAINVRDCSLNEKQEYDYETDT